MVKGIHRDPGTSHRARETRARLDAYVMHAGRSIGPSLMLESIWNFRGYILNESSAQGDVEQLWAAADCHQRNFHLLRGAHQRNLGVVAREVRFAARGTSGLSIKRRLYIFAAGEQDPVDARENFRDCVSAGKRGNYKWYEPCTFQRGDVSGVQSYAMRISVGGVCRR
jgi:hypothetical protein